VAAGVPERRPGLLLRRHRRLLVFLTDPQVIGRILRHLGLQAEPPALAPPQPAGSRSVEFWRE